MESINSIYEIKCNIPDEAFDEFQSMITPEKIFEFYEETKVYTEKSKFKETNHKINKQNFLYICQNIFSSSKNLYFNDIYDLIFERFKEKKCVFKANTFFSQNIYCLSDIISTEKIELFVIEIFFCCIMKTEFRKKIETMFFIIDSDSDGLINEREIKKLVLTTNKLFCEESSEYFSGSTLIQQSLSNLKAKKALENLLYGQGELKKKFWVCKYLSFDEFYNSLIKIDNYKYNIIPTFINLKKCLLTKRKEIEFDMNKKFKKDFLKISYELINKNNNLNNTKNFLKKCFDQKKILKRKKIDPLKEIKEKKEKDKKMKKIIQMKREEKHKKTPNNTNSFFYKNKISSFSENKIKDINNNKDIRTKHSSDSKNQNKNYNISKCIKVEEFNNNIQEEKNQTYNNKFYPLKKLNSLDTKKNNKEKDNYFKEQLNIIKRKSINMSSAFKSLFFKKKGILRSSSNISSSLNKTEVDLKKNYNLNKFVSFSDNKDMKHCLSHESITEISTSNFNLDTNNSSSAKKFSLKSEEEINFIKIPIINLVEKKKKISISNDNSKIITNNKNKSVISRRNTFIKSEYFNKKKYLEKGDYYKFTSIVFPPCIINIKEKNNNYFSANKKEALTERILKNRCKKSKKEEIDEYDCLLKTYDEVKDEVLYELEQQKNNDIHGLSAILKIEKNIEEKKNNLPIIDLSNNQVETRKSFFNHKNLI